MKLETGICGEQSVRVSAENTAKTMGSGTLDVFATPALVALAEKTCWQSVAPALEAGSGTVGTKLELEHTAPTPVGMTVTCESELTAVEGRCHGLLIHQRASGRVEQNGPGLHLRQRLRVDKAPGLGRGRAVQAEDIAPPQQGIIIHKLHTVGGVFGPDGAGADQHLHAKGSGNAGRLPPDAAIAVNAIGLAIELHLGQQADALRDIQLPASLLDGTGRWPAAG